ncbi:MAG: ribbon-helix-helix domain-containing protein [bacterium]|nr:ribbon-helix-helix domain-containing protein [bacterium]
MRTTSDPKNEKIKLRLNEDMKHHVDKQSEKEGTSISEYIRELIRQDMINNIVHTLF